MRDVAARVYAEMRRGLGLAGDASPMIEIDLDHPQLAGIPAGDRARAIATCASAAVVARPTPRGRAGARA